MNNDENSADSTQQDKAPADQENPLANIMVNILIPVIALSWLSKDGDKAWHVGPINGMIIAVLLPTVYFIWHFIKVYFVRNNNEGSPFQINSLLLADYIDAETHGKNNGDCFQRYGMCPFSIRSLLPKVISLSIY